jgi:hypothetical protein
VFKPGRLNHAEGFFEYLRCRDQNDRYHWAHHIAIAMGRLKLTVSALPQNTCNSSAIPDAPDRNLAILQR